MLVSAFSESSAEVIYCGTIQKVTFPHVSCMKTCTMWEAKIASDSVKINRHEFVDGLTFGINKDILFLPIEVELSFPNLIGYTATSNFVTSIGKQHFENLRKLRELRLNKNRIETIASDTFEDLISLQWLALDENKIKTLNGRQFASLNNLQHVNLIGNDCIDESFLGGNKISNLPNVVTEKCTLSQHQQHDQSCFQFLEAINNKTASEKDILMSELSSKMAENTQHLISIAKLQEEVSYVKAAKLQSETQSSLLIRVYENLDAQRNETFLVKTEELRNTVALKLQEVDELLEEKQRIEAERNEMREEIKALKSKLENLMNSVF